MHRWIGNHGVPGANKKAREQAARLRLIRERIHRIRTQAQFAARLGVEYNRYNHWEAGVQKIPSEQATKIKAMTPGVDLDYILDGEEGGLSVDALNKLKGKSLNSE